MTETPTLWAAFARGEYAAVIAVARRILGDRPQHAESLQLLAAASFEQGDLATAMASYRQLAALQPEQTGHWTNLGAVQREAGLLVEAKASYQQAAAVGATGVDFHLNSGLLFWDLGEIDAAHEQLAIAHAMDPDDAAIALAYGGLCCQTVRQQQALLVLLRWRQWRALAESQLMELSSWLLQLGEMREAEAVLRLALTLEPEHVLAKIRLSGLLERLNKLDEADALLSLLASAPADADTRLEWEATRARLLQRRGHHAQAVGLYQALLPLPAAQKDRQELCFSLAKSLDALSRYDEAYAALQDAHAAQIDQLSRYTPKAVAHPEPLRIADYSVVAADVAAWSHPASETARPDPVFVVGFPRSGTTLLEQLLDAHPLLRSMDEQPFLQLAISDIQASGATYPEQLAPLTPAQVTAVRAAYWARVATKVALPDGVRLVDKNPLNMLRLPAIRRLFPDARIILVVRHPCDVLLSCFMQNFRAPEFAMLCRSLDSLVTGYCKAFDFWCAQQAILQARVMELRYESFVQDVPGTARALTDFIGLPWDERLLDPTAHAQQRGYISTPSYAQVVKPVSRDAIDRWRRYAPQFAPLLPQLAPQLAHWGYDDTIKTADRSTG